ncbi:MAG: septal ring lytic transglycosylase RlpA family protein [Patescibacteria group bacterium]
MTLIMVAVILIATSHQTAPLSETLSLGQPVKVSFYGDGFDGRTMANGQIFRKKDPRLSAHLTYPLGTKLRVTDVDTLMSLEVEVTDRGPRPSTGCGLDLSEAAANYFGFRVKGHARLFIKVISTP